jgi:uncharacterized membrane protein required for colicin V production
MGLDLALGIMILLGAFRGWFKGFVSQSVRLAGFVACFYLADPVREEARPYVLARMPAIDPGLMDRILWWVAAVISYVVLVGMATLAIKLTRSPEPPGAPKSKREDKIGGMVLGTAKAFFFAALIGAGVQRYAAELVGNAPWAERQLTGSYALRWTETYQPIPRIWSTPPVRAFVEHIQRNGLLDRTELPGAKKVAERTSADTAADVPPRLDLTPAERPEPAVSPSDKLDTQGELTKELEEINAQLEALRQP